jgi:CHASE3 domain sensor protein
VDGMNRNSGFQWHRNHGPAAIFTIAGGVMLDGLVAIFFIGRAVIEADHDLLRQHTMISELQETLSTLKDAETGQRGYLLTGNDEYLEPYGQALARINEEIEVLDGRAKVGELPKPEMNNLRKLIEGKLAELQETISLRRTQGLPAALTLAERGGFEPPVPFREHTLSRRAP